MTDIVCISPVDGSEVARRKAATDAEIASVLAAARAARRAWAAVPLAERKRTMLEMLAAMQAQNQEIVPELAMQMGRPVRYGGELGSRSGCGIWSSSATRRWPMRRLLRRPACDG